MRGLMWFGIGLGCACALGCYLNISVFLWVIACFALYFGIMCWVFFRKKRKILPVVCVLFGLGLGGIWFQLFSHFRLDPIRELDGVEKEAIFEICDYSWERENGDTVDGFYRVNGKEYRVRIYLFDSMELSPGDQIEGEFYFWMTDRGGAEEATYHSADGIFLLASQRSEIKVFSGIGRESRYTLIRMRSQILNCVDQVFPHDTAAFAKALLLGDTTDFDFYTDLNLKLSGIRHVAAVSGLHVAILLAFIHVVTGKRRWPTALIGIPVLLLFAALSGFSPSITRACIMQGLMLLALLLNRQYDTLSALSAACVIMLCVNPLSATSVGFQLSAGAVLGVGLFADKIRRWLLNEKRLGKWLRKKKRNMLLNWFASSVSMSISASVFTVPLSAVYFGSVSLLAPLTNLLTLWLISFLFYGIVFACVFGFVWPVLGQGIAAVVSVGIRYVLTVASLIARIPFAAVYTCSKYVVIWLILCGILGILLWIRKGRNLKWIAVGAGIGLVLAISLSWGLPLLHSSSMTVMDVGHGQCILLRSGGKSYLVDCGGDRGKDAAQTAWMELKSRGVFHLDGVILTHLDEDHVGGVEYLLSVLPTDVLYTPEKPGVDHAIYTVRNPGGAEQTILTTQTIQWKQAEIRIIPSENLDSSNEAGLCVLFREENCDILITGDRSESGEMSLLAHHDIPQLDVLIAGHHGARDSTCEELLDRLKPATVMISVGKDNHYGHPHLELLQRLDSLGCEIFRTDWNGTIQYTRYRNGETTCSGYEHLSGIENSNP